MNTIDTARLAQTEIKFPSVFYGGEQIVTVTLQNKINITLLILTGIVIAVVAFGIFKMHGRDTKKLGIRLLLLVLSVGSLYLLHMLSQASLLIAYKRRSSVTLFH